MNEHALYMAINYLFLFQRFDKLINVMNLRFSTDNLQKNEPHIQSSESWNPKILKQ